MGIRTIEVYLRERKLLQNAPLSALANTRLGIDASHYLKSLLSDPDSREPLVASLGGLPLSLVHKIENDLRALDRLGIKPVFVFAGLPTASRPPPKGLDTQADRESAVKNEAWAFYESGQVERAVVSLTQIRGGAWADYRDVTRLILRIFRHRFVEYVVAPYLQFAQLAYLLKHPKGYIHAIYSSTEALLWPIDKVITSIDWTGSFTFVDKPRLLSDLALTHDQFLDVSILAGCSLSRTFPPFANDFALSRILDLIRQYKSGIAVCQTWRQDPQFKAQGYGDAFMRARLAVKYSLIMTTDGTCMPLPLVVQPAQTVTVADVPGDLDEIFSLRLPDEVYFHVCRGMISPQVVGWLTSGMIIEPQPLADSPDYRRFIKDVVTEGLTSPRCTTLALLAETLHPQWKQRRVSTHYYFDPPYAPPLGANVPFADLVTQSLLEKCATWAVPTVVLEAELRRQNSSTIDIRLCIGTLENDTLALTTKRDKNTKPLEKKDEIVANVIWRFLDVRGFVALNHAQTVMGKALHAACLHSRVNDRFQESIYLLLELLRAGVVHGVRWGGPDAEPMSGGPTFGSEEEQASSLLIMRVMSILPLNFRAQQWVGPLSRELLVFNSFVRSLTKALRSLFEGLTVHLLLTGDARRNRDDYADIMLSLPFQGEVNTGCGILVKTYLDAATFHFEDSITEADVDSERVQEAKRAALLFVEQNITSVKMPTQEVERGFRFWDSVMVAIRSLEQAQNEVSSAGITVTTAEVIEQFEQADRWLRPMRP